VAPDIVVELRRKGRKLARPGDTLSAGAAARAPRFKEDSIAVVPDEPEQTPRPPAGRGAKAAAGRGVKVAAESGAKAAAESGAKVAAESGATGAAKPNPTPRRRSTPSVELERLGARLASANHSLEQERERRAALAKSLEEERTTNRQLRTELGQARVELEVAATARAEATAVEAELEDARRQLRATQRRHEADTEALTRRHEEATQALAGDHEEVTQAHAALQEELRQHAEALELTREALAAERAEAGRLRNRLAQAQEARQRGGTAPGARTAGSARSTAATAGAVGTPEAAEAEPRVSRRASRAAARHREPDPSETQRFDVLGFSDELESGTAPPSPSRDAPRGSAQQTPDTPAWNPPVADRLRPLNPSLRHRTWWLGRLLALIVLCGVIAAVYLVLHTTVLH
jgi:hypothetical protein